MTTTHNTLLYLKGPPGSGKITTARILQRELGWTLFWCHDLDNIIANVIGPNGARKGRLRTLLDKMTRPVLEHLLKERKNIIYVRPSRSKETVDKVRDLVREVDEYIETTAIDDLPPCKVCVVNLFAPYETLVNRVERREQHGLRVHSKEELDEYLTARQQINAEGECTVTTNDCTPEYVAQRVKYILGLTNEIN